ncbi:MAG: DNA-3-methyladenine glycosylase 2 family protein [Flavisolibacter sp.]|nr:DNA-3-methyladenine glycosylase 2 family protein [Flavisolibacter sp.]
MIQTFGEENLQRLYDLVAKKDKDLKAIIAEYDYPPVWIRPNTFETLILTILEQQVSLASAYSAYKKLKERIRIAPKNLLQLTDEELRSCYLSRQKIVYTRELAKAITEKRISLKKFESLPDAIVRSELKAVKGIGDWTVDIYLLHALRRTDIFPIGDLALVNSIKMVKQLSSPNKEDLLELSKKWKPYRSMATMLFWHYYIKKRNINILH